MTAAAIPLRLTGDAQGFRLSLSQESKGLLVRLENLRLGEWRIRRDATRSATLERLEMNVKPYYEADGVAIYHGDCREIIPQLPAVPGPDLILTDPPYGINYRSTHNSGWRQNGEPAKWRREKDFPGIIGDDAPLDPAHLFIGRKHIIFGGNYCADRLPVSRGWIIWDKNDGKTPSNQADCELIWTDIDKPARVFRHLWRGIMRAGEENVTNGLKLHPHQKPLALLRFLLEFSEVKCAYVLDPYCGSGSTLLAAAQLGHFATGIEIDEKYCEIAAKRLVDERTSAQSR